MALFKRNKTWWTDFSVNGQRYRQSLHTTDWRKAQADEKTMIANAKQGKLSAAGQHFARLAFSEAARQFLADREASLAPKSVRTEKERWTAIFGLLGTLPVSHISADTLRAYIRARKEAGVANATVNRELDIIRGVLKRAKRWHLVEDEIKPLPVRQNIGRALTYEQKIRLLRLAASRPEWQTAYLAAVLALNTTMRGCEIRQLTWGDINLIDKSLIVRRSKTEAGERVIPLNSEAWDAVLSLYSRARRIGEVQAGHYVFPTCEPSHFDPLQPMKSWRTAWRNLTRVIHCPICGTLQKPGKTCSKGECMADIRNVRSPLAGLRFHDLRHHAITELAESQSSESTILEIAGHVSPKMLRHYSHVRMAAKRRAVDALSVGPTAPKESGGNQDGYDTNCDTIRQAGEIPASQVIENMVELTGIEPVASSLRTRRSPS